MALGTVLTNRNEVRDERRRRINYGRPAIIHFDNSASRQLFRTSKIRMYNIMLRLSCGCEKWFLSLRIVRN
jgi:hypothetical protein